MPKEPLRDVDALLKQLTKPLIGLVSAGSNGDMLRSKMHAQSLVMILDTCGYWPLARKLSLAIE